MGTALKVLGIMFIGFWLMVGIGCSMMVGALRHGSAAAHTYSSGSDRDHVVQALQDGRIDLARTPDDVTTSQDVTITLRDGSTRKLGNGLADRIVREAVAERIRRTAASSSYGADDSPYDRPYVPRPHFKPGEPMVNPTPSGSSDDD